MAEFRKRAETAWGILDAHLAGRIVRRRRPPDDRRHFHVRLPVLRRRDRRRLVALSEPRRRGSRASRRRRAGGIRTRCCRVIRGRRLRRQGPSMAKKNVPANAGFATIEVAIRNGIGIVALNRPDVHNAFNEMLIAELTEALLHLGADDGVRAIVLTGNGPSFCAGADLQLDEEDGGRTVAPRTWPTPTALARDAAHVERRSEADGRAHSRRGVRRRRRSRRPAATSRSPRWKRRSRCRKRSSD